MLSVSVWDDLKTSFMITEKQKEKKYNVKGLILYLDRVMVIMV